MVDRRKFEDNLEKALRLKKKNDEKNRQARLRRQRRDAKKLKKENEKIARKGKHAK